MKRLLIVFFCLFLVACGPVDFDDLDCDDLVDDLVPQNVVMYNRGDWTPTEFVWNDGKEFKQTSVLLFNVYGNNEEFYHLKKPGLETLTYSSEVDSKHDKFLARFSFEIRPVLSPKKSLDETHIISNLGEYPTKLFEIVDYEIISCNLNPNHS